MIAINILVAALSILNIKFGRNIQMLLKLDDRTQANPVITSVAANS